MKASSQSLSLYKPSKSSCLTAAEIERKLVAAGIQPTAQRIAICRYVLCESDHPTAEQVKAWADKNFPKLSLATVYNTLRTLVDGKLLREYRFPHSEKVIYDSYTEFHYHFLDEKTGDLYDVDPAGLNIESKLGKGVSIDSVEVLLRGKLSKARK